MHGKHEGSGCSYQWIKTWSFTLFSWPRIRFNDKAANLITFNINYSGYEIRWKWKRKEEIWKKISKQHNEIVKSYERPQMKFTLYFFLNILKSLWFHIGRRLEASFWLTLHVFCCSPLVFMLFFKRCLEFPSCSNSPLSPCKKCSFSYENRDIKLRRSVCFTAILHKFDEGLINLTIQA